jgi:hypothetical protein
VKVHDAVGGGGAIGAGRGALGLSRKISLGREANWQVVVFDGVANFGGILNLPKITPKSPPNDPEMTVGAPKLSSGSGFRAVGSMRRARMSKNGTAEEYGSSVYSRGVRFGGSNGASPNWRFADFLRKFEENFLELQEMHGEKRCAIIGEIVLFYKKGVRLDAIRRRV